MVNINIELPEDLHKKMKIVSALKGVSLKDYVTRTLENIKNDHNQANIKIEEKQTKGAKK